MGTEFYISDALSWTEQQARDARGHALSRPALRTMGFRRIRPGIWRDEENRSVGYDRMFHDSMPKDLAVADDPRGAHMARKWLRERTGERVGVENREEGHIAFVGDRRVEARGEDEHEATARLIVVLAAQGDLPLPANQDVEYLT